MNKIITLAFLVGSLCALTGCHKQETAKGKKVAQKTETRKKELVEQDDFENKA